MAWGLLLEIMEVVFRDGSLSPSLEKLDISLSEPVLEGDLLAVHHIYQSRMVKTLESFGTEMKVMGSNNGKSQAPQG